MRKFYHLQLFRPNVHPEHKQLCVLSVVREIAHETPQVGTWVTIRAEDEEWEDFAIQVTSLRQVSDDRLVIEMSGKFDMKATDGLAPLRAQEILRNAEKPWQTDREPHQ